MSQGPLSNIAKIVDARSKRISSYDRSGGNGDNIQIKKGETAVIAEMKGAGIVKHIWVTIACDDPLFRRNLVLRCYWDGCDHPSVEAPIGDFFGSGFGLRKELKSVPVQVEGGDGYNCYWPMPFARHAVITITNENPEKSVRSFYYHIDYSEETLPEKTAYFCAQYRNEFPEKTGKIT